MMTRPIHHFDSLTTEAGPAGGNSLMSDVSYNERRLLEMRARYSRAAMVGNALTDSILWVGRLFKRLAAAIKEDFKVRAAEEQLHRMSDRELADLGLCRADIPFAVRKHEVEGVEPAIDNHYAADVAAANRNNPAIFWAGRA
jgi:uncharacterized protein YjiS (DUF1127 family)